MTGDKVYYDLIEIEWQDSKVGYIPAPMFMKSDSGIVWLSNLMVSKKLRDQEFFSCGFCGKKGFFETCRDCKDKRTEDTLKKRKEFLVGRIIDGKGQPADVVRAIYIKAKPFPKPEAKPDAKADGKPDAVAEVKAEPAAGVEHGEHAGPKHDGKGEAKP